MSTWLLVCLVACGGGPAVRAGGTSRVEDAHFVAIGGLEQWITIRGDRDHAHRFAGVLAQMLR